MPQFLFVVCMVRLLTKSGQEIRIKYKVKFKIHPIKWIHSCNKLSISESYGCKSQFTQAELIKQVPAKGQSLLNNYILIHALFLLLELLCLKVSRWLMTMKHFNKLYEWRHVIGVKGNLDAWWVSTGIASWHLSPNLLTNPRGSVHVPKLLIEMPASWPRHGRKAVNYCSSYLMKFPLFLLTFTGHH